MLGAAPITIRFLRLEVRHAKSFGIVFSKNNGNSPHNEIIQCDVHHTGNGSGDALNGHGDLHQRHPTKGKSIRDNEGYGLHLHADSTGGWQSVTRNVVRNNRIYGNGTHGGFGVRAGDCLGR